MRMNDINSTNKKLLSFDYRGRNFEINQLKQNSYSDLLPLSRSIGENNEIINTPILPQSTYSKSFYQSPSKIRNDNYCNLKAELIVSQSPRISESLYCKYYNLQNYISGPRLVSPSKNNMIQDKNKLLSPFTNLKVKNHNLINHEDLYFNFTSPRIINEKNFLQSYCSNLSKSISLFSNKELQSSSNRKLIDNLKQNYLTQSVTSLIELRNNILKKYYKMNSKGLKIFNDAKLNNNNNNNHSLDNINPISTCNLIR